MNGFDKEYKFEEISNDKYYLMGRLIGKACSPATTTGFIIIASYDKRLEKAVIVSPVYDSFDIDEDEVRLLFREHVMHDARV